MKRILTIDGGGIKGVFPASFLAALEEQINDDIVNYFDLIVGTSTGGIIALGLGFGFSATEIVKFYTDLGPEIFKKSQTRAPWYVKMLVGALHKFIPHLSSKERLYEVVANLRDTKYDSEPLKSALTRLFGDRVLGDSQVRLVIPSFNLVTGDVHIYKTRHHERFESDYRTPAVDVAMATAAAPTFFPVYRTANGVPLVDGGIYANNPTAIGVVEALAVLGWRPEEIRVLSLGCTESPLEVNLDKQNLGLLDWGVRLLDTFMRAQSSQSLGIASLLANDHENHNIIRINPHVPPGKYSLDSVQGVQDLIALGASEARKQIYRLRQCGFFDTTAEKFVSLPLKNNACCERRAIIDPPTPE